MNARLLECGSREARQSPVEFSGLLRCCHSMVITVFPRACPSSSCARFTLGVIGAEESEMTLRKSPSVSASPPMVISFMWRNHISGMPTYQAREQKIVKICGDVANAYSMTKMSVVCEITRSHSDGTGVRREALLKRLLIFQPTFECGGFLCD